MCRVSTLDEWLKIIRFILWGRSMGAVAAVKYAELCYDKSKLGISYQKQQIIGMVLDSPFKSLSQLLVEIGHTQTQIPRFLIKAGYLLIKNALEQNGEFKIHELDLIDPDGVITTVGQNNDNNNQNTSLSSYNQKQQQSKYPLQKLHHLHLPILFLASKEDKTVPCQHSIDMFNSYNSKMKQIGFFKGLHNQSREEDYLERVVGFVRRVVGDNEKGLGDIDDDDKKFYVNNQVQLKSLSSKSNVCSNNKINMNMNNKDNNNINNNNNNPNIPDPLNLQQPPIKKPSLIQLIQQRFFKPTQQQYLNGGTQTLLQAETIQSSCVCTMFDNNNQNNQNNFNNQNNKNNNNINTFEQTSREKYTTSRSYRQQKQQEHYNNNQSHKTNIYNNNHNKQPKFPKDIQPKNYNWPNNNRSNHFIETNKSFVNVNSNNYFNCDRRISLNSHSNNLKLLVGNKVNQQQKELHGDDCMVNYQRENLFSRKEIKQAIKYNQFNMPLRTVSEKNLRQGAGERYFYG